MAPLIVTGYVPLENHPRSAETYHALGERLMAIPDTYLCEGWLDDCWLYEALVGQRCIHKVGDNPQKNTLGYHIVQHQKTEWLMQAAALHDDADPLIWVDYGVFGLPGMTDQAISAFMIRIALHKPELVIVPGCWAKQARWNDNVPCWRFCGTVLICPRDCVGVLDGLVKLNTKQRLRREHTVTWEVNTWAHVEHMCPEIFGWYKADHNASLFLNYGAEYDRAV